MVRRRTAKALKLNEETVCVNVSGLLVENRPPGLDDDPRVLGQMSIAVDVGSDPGLFPALRTSAGSVPDHN
jgi:hypothetical protein